MLFFQEYLKPIFATGDADTRKTAQITLYRALEIGLRLLSPFMPFISEELYQRLPHLEATRNEVPSISVASYPTISECSWKNETIEDENEFIQKVAKAIRSARSDYNLPNKTKTEGRFPRKLSIFLYSLSFYVPLLLFYKLFVFPRLWI